MHTQLAFSLRLALWSALYVVGGCAREHCDSQPISVDRFVERTARGEFVVPGGYPFIDDSGDTLSEDELRVYAAQSFSFTVYENCDGQITHSRLRPANPADTSLAEALDSLFAATPGLRDELHAAHGGPPPPTADPGEAERLRIEQLVDAAARRAYLDELTVRDQEIRGKQEGSLVDVYGYDSPQVDSFRQLFMARDRENFARIHHFVRHHGYPRIDSVGKAAAGTPWLIYHHTHYGKFQRENFDTLAVAYRRGDLDDDMLALYLGRAYRQRFGERHSMPNPYTPERELDTLVGQLGWEWPDRW